MTSKLTIHVGSTNPVKIAAVQEAAKPHPWLAHCRILGLDVFSEVSEQPTSLDETIRGAVNRARNAFIGCDLSIGIEDGLGAVPYTQSGYMNFCACAIFDGRRNYLGLASAFEYPPQVVRLVMEEGLDITQAFHKIGLSDNPALGAAQGAIGIMTKGLLTRTEYAQQAVAMALIHVDLTNRY